MSDRLSKQVAVELEQLARLIEVHRPLLDKCENLPPTDIELSALAAMLHSFYTGIENIFKRVCVERGVSLPAGAAWHRELLDSMSKPGGFPGLVISPVLGRRLEEYLKFRHVFRQAYSFQLQWEKVSSLILNCDDTLRCLIEEMSSFLQRSEKY